MISEAYDLNERKCPKCKKMFVPAPYHVYAAGVNKKTLYCSWTCFLHRNDKKKGKQNEKS